MNVFTELERHFETNGKHNEDVLWYRIYVNDHKLTGDGSFTQEHLDLMKTIDYDDGYGSQELGGTIVFKDSSWLERGEYDGSEWWDYKSTPEWSPRAESGDSELSWCWADMGDYYIMSQKWEDVKDHDKKGRIYPYIGETASEMKERFYNERGSLQTKEK